MCSYTSIEAFSLDGFPHSESHGSRLACSSPWIFAAYRVFLRLLVPRHSPYALRSLIFLLAFSQCFLPNFKNILFLNNTSSCFAFISSLFSFQGTFFTKNITFSVVGSNGLEPSTSRLSGVRSNHLSYEPI